MPQTSHQLIRGLWPLPGGNDRYLHTLDRILKWVSSTPEANRDTFSEWFMSRYNVSDSTVYSYLQVVVKLGALQSDDDGNLTLAPLGERIIEAEGEVKARVVIERFMRDYLAFPEVLAVYAQADGSIHLEELVETLQPHFLSWTSAAQFEYRVLWLLSLGCLQQDRGRYYEITDLGEAITEEFPPSIEISAPVVIDEGDGTKSPVEQTLLGTEVTKLIEELQEAATDSQAPERFERAVAAAFEFLGFAVDHMGEPGETDVIVRARIGSESYACVVDAKSRGSGKLRDLNVYTLKEHRRRNEADYATVVANDFAGKKIVRHAKDNDVVLLPLSSFNEWLRLHALSPLNLREYRVMFETPGLVEYLPTALELAREEQERWGQLLVDLMELIRETYAHGLLESLPTDNVHYMLVTRLGGVRYPKQDVQDAVTFLTHPAIHAASDQETGISLTMNRSTLARTLRALADQIEIIESET